MLTFANPVFLWGLLGLAAPILIHLINRDLFRPLRFPSLRFILRGKLPVERKRRLRDFLLLALRMLLFAAIIAALARPQWQPEATAATDGGADGELVILVDASASMSGWNSWEEAVAKAGELLSQNPRSAAGLVISADGPITVEPLTREHSRLRLLLNRANPLMAAGDHRESFLQALRLFRGESNRTLAVISDFQQSDWTPATLPQVDPATQVQWFQVNRSDRDNAGIINARALPLPDGKRQVIAKIRNFGEHETGRTVRLQAGDETLTREIRLAPGERRSVSFILEETAASRAEVRIDPDGYPADDSHFVWLARPPPLRVLIVAPVTEEPETAEELFFLSRALGARTETQWLHFAVKALEPGQLNEISLQNVRAVFLLGAAPYLNTAEWTLLGNYLENGGRLLFTPGKAPARQTTLMAHRNILNLSYEGMAGIDHRRPRPHSIDWVLPESPIDILFRDEAARALSHVSIYRYVRLESQDPNGTVLLRTTDEDPLLIERAAGEGRVFATAFPFQTTWTDLPVSAAFLPIVRELVAGGLPPDHGIVNIDTGIETSTLAALLNLPAEALSLSDGDLLTPGIHLVANTPVVINTPRSESLPSQINPIDLKTAVAPATYSAATMTADADVPVLPLWHWLATAALLLFIIEMPVAARIRHLRHTSKASMEATPAESAPRTS